MKKELKGSIEDYTIDENSDRFEMLLAEKAVENCYKNIKDQDFNEFEETLAEYHCHDLMVLVAAARKIKTKVHYEFILSIVALGVGDPKAYKQVMQYTEDKAKLCATSRVDIKSIEEATQKVIDEIRKEMK